MFYFPTNQHEFNLHARSRARNIHHCRRGKGRKWKIKRRNKGEENKDQINQRFYPRSNETRANFQLDFLFRFEYKSPRICSPLFRLLLLYVAPRGEKYSNVIVTRWSPRKWSRIRGSPTDSSSLDDPFWNHFWNPFGIIEYHALHNNVIK